MANGKKRASIDMIKESIDAYPYQERPLKLVKRETVEKDEEDEDNIQKYFESNLIKYNQAQSRFSVNDVNSSHLVHKVPLDSVNTRIKVILHLYFRVKTSKNKTIDTQQPFLVTF